MLLSKGQLKEENMNDYKVVKEYLDVLKTEKLSYGIKRLAANDVKDILDVGDDDMSCVNFTWLLGLLMYLYEKK